MCTPKTGTRPLWDRSICFLYCLWDRSIVCFLFLYGLAEVVFPVLGLSPYKPGRKSTGKKTPCNLAKQQKLTSTISCKRTNVRAPCYVVSMSSCWAVPVETWLEIYRKEKPCNHLAKYFGASRWRIAWNRALRERERKKYLSIETHFLVYIVYIVK